MMTAPKSSVVDQRPVFFFDVDDCLYPQSLEVPKLMHGLLERFVMDQLSISKDEAIELMYKYYNDHGLTVVGLEKHHQIDPMLYNEKNDDSLPLDDLLSPDKALRAMLERFDTSKVKLWLFTNAHITHCKRVVRLLGVDDLFEGVTYCDYSDGRWTLKPGAEMFDKAEKEAGVTAPNQCYLVDDSPRNCKAAFERGWQVVRIVDPEVSNWKSEESPAYQEINSLSQLHDIFPQFSK